MIAGLAAALFLSILVSLPLIVWNWRRAVEHERIAQTRTRRNRFPPSPPTPLPPLPSAFLPPRTRTRPDEGFEVAHHAFGDLFRMIGNPDAEELSESNALNKELLERGLKYYSEFVDSRRDDP